MLEIKDDGKKIRLYQLRNPHGREMHFNGTWNMKNPKWQHLKKQVDHWSEDPKEGIFYVEEKDFKDTFWHIHIARYNPNWVTSHYTVEKDDINTHKLGKNRLFNITIKKQGETYVYVEFYNKRMYAKGCNPGDAQAFFTIKKIGEKNKDHKKMQEIPFRDNAFVAFRADNWTPGVYEIEVQADYSKATQHIVRDYTLKVYHHEEVHLKFEKSVSHDIVTDLVRKKCL
jgi:hypothetical protein